MTRDELDVVKQKQKTYTDQIEVLVHQNQNMKQRLQDPEKLLTYEGDQWVGFEPPFGVYMVEKGETLFSIARNYYKGTDMVPMIVKWNQGWIRNENNIMAGLGLVLFRKSVEDKSPQAVERYLEQL
jgi:hypothetical protein